MNVVKLSAWPRHVSGGFEPSVIIASFSSCPFVQNPFFSYSWPVLHSSPSCTNQIAKGGSSCCICAIRACIVLRAQIVAAHIMLLFSHLSFPKWPSQATLQENVEGTQPHDKNPPKNSIQQEFFPFVVQSICATALPIKDSIRVAWFTVKPLLAKCVEVVRSIIKSTNFILITISIQRPQK